MTPAGDSTTERKGADPTGETPRREKARHSIGLVSERTGLSPHVLRAWESRYGAVEPARTEGGHRAYTDAQLHRLRLLARLTDRGHRIGRIATMPTGELEEMARREVAGRGREPAEAGSEGGEEPSGAFLREALEAVEIYDGDRLDRVLRRAALGLSARALVEEVSAPLLEEVGERWSAGDLHAGQEHLASAVVDHVMAWVMDGFTPPSSAPVLVATTPAGEAHSLGALLAAATAAAGGWRVHYLGGDLPAREIARTARETGARAVALSVVHPPGRAETAEELRDLAARLPEGVALLVGGEAARSYRDVLEEVGARHLPDYASLRSELVRVRDGGDAGGDPADGGDSGDAGAGGVGGAPRDPGEGGEKGEGP